MTAAPYLRRIEMCEDLAPLHRGAAAPTDADARLLAAAAADVAQREGDPIGASPARVRIAGVSVVGYRPPDGIWTAGVGAMASIDGGPFDRTVIVPLVGSAPVVVCDEVESWAALFGPPPPRPPRPR